MKTTAIDLPAEPEYPVLATLHFLPAGHYLFRSQGGGKVAKFVTAADVAAAFSQKEQDSGWMPAGVVRCGHNASGPWFVYSAPAQTVLVMLEGEAQTLRVPMPRTVLLGMGSDYWMWATKSEHFDPTAEGCAMPTPNVHPDGHVCWGSAAPGKASPARARLVWELFFGASAFNGHLVGNVCQSQPLDVRVLLRDLAERKVRKFPVDELVVNRQGLRIEGMVKLHIGGER